MIIVKRVLIRLLNVHRVSRGCILRIISVIAVRLSARPVKGLLLIVQAAIRIIISMGLNVRYVIVIVKSAKEQLLHVQLVKTVNS